MPSNHYREPLRLADAAVLWLSSSYFSMVYKVMGISFSGCLTNVRL